MWKCNGKKEKKQLVRLFLQAVEKPLVNIKNGVAGAKPPTGSRGGSPSKIPLSGERGQGDRDSELEICFKQSLFLQSEPQFSLRLKLLKNILFV